MIPCKMVCYCVLSRNSVDVYFFLRFSLIPPLAKGLIKVLDTIRLELETPAACVYVLV